MHPELIRALTDERRNDIMALRHRSAYRRDMIRGPARPRARPPNRRVRARLGALMVEVGQRLIHDDTTGRRPVTG
jgi:hypothetical protein